MKKNLSTFLILISISLTVTAQNNAIIPCPSSFSYTGNSFRPDARLVSYSTSDLKEEAAYLQQALQERGAQPTLKESKKKRKGFFLEIDSTRYTAEGYRLTLSPKYITLTGGSDAGVFYAIQTLLQQWDAHNGLLPSGTIEDTPRYSWRGIMLDEARHFFGKQKVKQILDLMAYYKLNKFHWHLTDEPAWRIEIKKYPLLTSIGGRGSWSNPDTEQDQFYTQNDIREIISYATERHIEIIPEIDMPGHATAANRAYPELSGGGTSEHPEFTFNVGKKKTYDFLTDVLREVADLFPSRYLHIGGDEVSYGIEAWKTDSAIQSLIKRKHLPDVKAAEHYFINRMADSVKTLGKILAGWDELLDAHPNQQQTLIMWWRHDRINSLKKSITQDYATIMCPRRPLYLDFIQHKNHKWGRVWNGFCPLKDVYMFPDEGFATWNLPQNKQKFIQGLQANVWTERIHTPQRLDFMLFPRLCAVAEAGWTRPDNKNYNDFCRRMEYAYRIFDRMGIYYFDNRNPEHHPEPVGAVRKDKNIPMDFRD